MLSSYINPGGAIPLNFFTEEEDDESESESGSEQSQLPLLFHDLLQQSCLLPAVSSYLRNDSGNIETKYYICKHGDDSLSHLGSHSMSILLM